MPVDEQRLSEGLDFDALYRREYAAAVRLAALLASSIVAEDLAQEAFARVHASAAALHSPGGYLRTTLVNLCRGWHRKEGRGARAMARIFPSPEEMDHGDIEVLDAVASLPYRQRAVVVLRYWSGLTEREIAEALGCRPGTVKSLAHRALNALRKELT